MPEVASTVRLAAPAAAVYEAAKDIEGLAPFIDNLESITVIERREVPGGLETVTQWVGLLPEFGRKIKWTERDRWDDAERSCVFEQADGDFDLYHGTWTFAETDGVTESTLTIQYTYDVPLIGPLIQRLVLKKMQESVEATQRGLERRVAGGSG